MGTALIGDVHDLGGFGPADVTAGETKGQKRRTENSQELQDHRDLIEQKFLMVVGYRIYAP